MSEQDLNQDQEAIEDSQPTELDEFKASMGDPSEVPEPTSTTATAPGPSKDQGDKVAPKQGSSKIEKPKEVGTKMGMINAMMKKMNGMDKKTVEMMMNMASMKPEQMSKMNAMMMPKKEGMYMSNMKKPKMGEETEYKITADDIDIKDDVKALFGNEDLSEEFKEKASTIFETAVVAKINEAMETYNTTMNESYQEDTQSIKNELSEKMDTYLDYVVEQWAQDNELAIETGLKAELTEDFMSGLKGLFEDHYIDLSLIHI